MNQKQVFEVGMRLLGLYFFLQGVPLLLTTIFELLVSIESRGEVLVREQLLNVLSVITYSLFVVIGIWLIKGASFFRRIALPEKVGESIGGMTELFTAGVKLFGIFVVIGMIPRLMQSLSYFLFIATSAPDSPASAIHFMGGRAYFVPHVASILFGLLLFFRGELLSNWAFAERRVVENPD